MKKAQPCVIQAVLSEWMRQEGRFLRKRPSLLLYRRKNEEVKKLAYQLPEPRREDPLFPLPPKK